MKRTFFFALTCLLLITACKPKQLLVAPPITENRDLDTLVVSAPKPDEFKAAEDFKLPNYNPTYTREHDLLHTKLALSFDWEKQYVIGKATLKLKPLFYATNYVELDAKNFDIHKVLDAKTNKALKFEYDGAILRIDLGKNYTRTETYTLLIDYTAKPAERDSFGGSTAITSDQGLFFINHDGSDPDKPMQIWTQGETEWNSRWFPTIDKPNERCTQEMYLTVKDNFKTLSNGLLLSSTKNNDGTRTDYWKMDLPHAPYLFMIGVGEFAVVTDKWNDIVVDYYVEPDFEEYARDIFANTLEMLDFFSEKTGVAYPWPKYSQVVVRDYVSGAMENTSAVIFGEFVQRTKQELIDDNNDKIVAHELFHHWFGDYVTCESWANLTMNEGFANYSEYLWLEHKYGKDEADYHLRTELNGYLGEARTNIHPLIHFGYNDKEDMFDAHSYNKGGLILHMLRNYVGDDAFWTALNKYLLDNQYSDVEADELRLAFEDVTGEDLNWFFDQWYFEAGHPELDINYEYDENTKQVHVIIEQKQNTDRQPAIFNMPFAIDIYSDSNKPMRKEVRMMQRKQRFSFDVNAKPKLVNVDADKVLLCNKTDHKTEAEYIFQFENAPLFLDRYEALMNLKDNESEASEALIISALKDPFWAIRGLALQYAPVDADLLPLYDKMARNDKHSDVRVSALERLGESGDKKYIATAKHAIEKDPAMNVISGGLQTLIELDEAAALAYTQKLKNSDNGTILTTVGEIYAASGDAQYLSFFEENWSKVDGYDAIDFVENYLLLAVENGDENLGKAISQLKQLGMDGSRSAWLRFGATNAIKDLRNEYKNAVEGSEGAEKGRFNQRFIELSGILEQIKKVETNKQLLQMYNQF